MQECNSGQACAGRALNAGRQESDSSMAGRDESSLKATDAFRQALGIEPASLTTVDSLFGLALCQWHTEWIEGFNLPASDDLVIAIHREGSRDVRALRQGGPTVHNSVPGSITIIPPHRPHSFAVKGAVSFETLHIPYQLLKEIDNKDNSNLLSFRFAVLDAFLCACIDALWGESRRMSDASPEFMSSVTRSLVLHLGRSREDELGEAAQGCVTLKRISSFICASLGEGLSVEELAEEAGMSPGHFSRKFRAEFGMSPHKYLIEKRVEKAKERLANSNDALIDISLDLGFSSQSHFTKVFKDSVGLTPCAYRAAISS